MKYNRNLFALCIGCALVQAGDMIITSFLPVLLTEIGNPVKASFWAGIIFAAGSLATAIMAPIWGTLADRYGTRPMLIRAGLTLTVSYAFVGFATNYIQVLFLKVFIGVLAGYIHSATMFIATTTPNEDLGFSMSLLQTTMAIGTISGPILGAGFVSLFELSGAYVASATLPLVATIIAIFVIKEKAIRKRQKTSIIKGMHDAISLPVLQILFATLILMQAGTACIRPTLPLLIQELEPQNPAFAISVIATLFGVATAIFAPLVGRYWKGNYISMLRDNLIALVLFMTLQGLSPSVYSLGIFRFISGAPSIALTVAINVLVAQAVPVEIRGTVFGVMNSMSSIGYVLGPLIGGFLGGTFGVASSFLGSAALYGVAGLVIVISYGFLHQTLKTDIGSQATSDSHFISPRQKRSRDI